MGASLNYLVYSIRAFVTIKIDGIAHQLLLSKLIDINNQKSDLVYLCLLTFNQRLSKLTSANTTGPEGETWSKVK